ncbi:hypothetical protein NM688_g2457 [Phlebia brevispora]|uniref:Uncharacterized protein n=1 Tax=Phlebia brevispora TaxID=194682 RepID=A0ACC1T893_9APHY|nr:hypothetical protein NM688_g2457 [Phlebia brevispora]
MQYPSLLTFALAVLSAAGNPVVSRRSLITLPFTKTINNTGIPNIVKYEQARLKAFKDDTYGIPTSSTESTFSVNIPATDAGIVHSAPVGIGTPPTYWLSSTSSVWICFVDIANYLKHQHPEHHHEPFCVWKAPSTCMPSDIFEQQCVNTRLLVHGTRVTKMISIVQVSAEKGVWIRRKLLQAGSKSVCVLSNRIPFYIMRYSLLTVVAVALAASATPIVPRQSPITLPFKKVINTAGTTNVTAADQARIKALKAATPGSQQQSPVNVPITEQLMFYSASVGIGTPPNYYDLLVDIAGANTWAGSETPYIVTSSSVDTGSAFEVLYSGAFAYGELYNDTVTLGTISIFNQGVGAATDTAGFSGPGLEGILGLGPTDLSLFTVMANLSEEVPTVVDSAYAQGLIPDHSFGLSFEPSDTAPITNGEITLGGVDSSKFYPDIAYTPVTASMPSAQYWGIDTAFSYNGETLLPYSAGILDSGVTNIYFPTEAFEKYQNATGAVVDETGWLTITEDQYESLADILFTIGDTQFGLPANGQIWPRALNEAAGLDPGKIYLVVQNSGGVEGFRHGLCPWRSVP